jgi:hypothetical protein
MLRGSQPEIMALQPMFYRGLGRGIEAICSMVTTGREWAAYAAVEEMGPLTPALTRSDLSEEGLVPSIGFAPSSRSGS